ncbi:methylated-DNA--[protein]-cysteine S-methyltransferase [Tenacibaculum sp. AHE15PA]|uniref:methylated-DNA--[protein]-cysteine S-methyltransferase n=1 Tax=unclassified Tenacibaculum TaxID=2635139 RepID=UPI001C4EB23A|nr:MULTISPECIES: methylated-DNA--[protein]-cysteine S-methyltransferase [unclassified Tenacibaculum]QXP73359.1 methylated-DNA--[protein]-cysteine S-methyltransferase [Tenacibaculum sp. AHE14PA]QXP74873.1 methylated-DNA--[protein]-cysteine S-methyltransferase [Tenacibaculum sp. AHE15PA]
MSDLQTTYYKTPIGTAKIVGNENGIQSVSVLDDAIETSTKVPSCLQNCVTQLEEYFTGTRTEFNLKLNPQGTAFQQKVWNELLNIPFNKSSTYLKQTKQVGDPKAIRAVASANGKNPIWIIIPCHRVIGSDGSLTGYAGGIWRKKWLLEHESGCKQQTLF